MAESPDAEIQFRSVRDDEDEQFQICSEPEQNSDLHIGQGDVIDSYMDRMQIPGRRPPSVKPETYDGSADWDEYLCHFQVCAELGKWDEREKVLALSASLRGAARTFFMSLAKSERGDYETLLVKLGQRFGSLRQQNRWLARFESRKRQPGESIAALGDDLRQMAQKAYVGLDSIAQEALALNQLYKTITLEMKCRCLDRSCQTVTEAVDIIERYEGILGDQSLKKPCVRAVSAETETRRNNSEIQRMFKELIDRIEKIEKNGVTNESKTNRTCFLCKSPDHFIRDCPMNTGEQGHRNNPRYRPQPQMPYQGAQPNVQHQGNGRPSSH